MKVFSIVPLGLLLLLGCAKVEAISQQDLSQPVQACSNQEEADACAR
jgi:hypothetical protein